MKKMFNLIKTMILINKTNNKRHYIAILLLTIVTGSLIVGVLHPTIDDEREVSTANQAEESLEHSFEDQTTSGDQNNVNNNTTTGQRTSKTVVTTLVFNESTTVQHEYYVINNDVVIFAGVEINFFNVTFEFNNTLTNPHGFMIFPNSSVTFNKSDLIRNNQNIIWYMNIMDNCSIHMLDTAISGIGIVATVEPTEQGLYVEHPQHLMLDNVTFSNTQNVAITLSNATQATLEGCSFTGGTTGIRMFNCENITIKDNSLSQISSRLISGININDSIIINNNLGLAIEFVQNRQSILINNGNNISIQFNEMYSGVTISEINNMSVKQNQIYGIDPNRDNLDYGIQLLSVGEVTILNNLIQAVAYPRGFTYGLFIGNQVGGNPTYNITVKGNTIDSFNERGLNIQSGAQVVIEDNFIGRGTTTTYNEDLNPYGVGLYLTGSSYQEIIRNNTFADLPLAMYFNNGSAPVTYSDTFIYLNNFIDNLLAYNETNVPVTAVWTIEGHGNYWSGFVSTDIDGNGICDTQKTIVPDEVQDTAPLFYENFPPEITVSYSHDQFIKNNVNQEIIWTIDDEDALTYTIWVNESIYRTNNLNDSSTVTLSVDGWNSSWYSVMFRTTDRWNNYDVVTSVFFIDPADTTAPVFYNLPTNITLREVAPEREFELNATDEHPDTYTSRLYNASNGILVQSSSGEWESDSNITISLGNLFEGNYILNVTAVDILTQEKTASIPVFVEDLGPYITSSDNRTVGQDGVTQLTWTMYDAEVIQFYLYQDGQLVDNGIWFNGVPYIYEYNTTNATLGLHIFRMKANDTNNFLNEDVTGIRVVDNTFPVITPYGENPTTVDEYDPPITFYWNASDRNPQNYSVSYYYYDETEENASWTLLETGPWAGEDINATFDPNNHTIGNYQIRAGVTDVGNNTAYSIGGQFQIIDTTPPNITQQPTNITWEYGYPVPTLNWTAEDRNPESYIVLVNSTVRDVQDWNGSQVRFKATEYLWTEVTPVEDRLGTYNLTIIFLDGGNNQANGTIWIVVQDTTPPVLTNYNPTLTRNHTSINEYFVLECEDTNLYYYNITLNQEDFRSAEFTNNTHETIKIYLRSLKVGSNHLTINLTDYELNNASYSMTITVTDYIAPRLKVQPSNITKQWPLNRVSLAWEFWDIRPASYELFSDNELLKTATWKDTIEVIINLDLGVHNITLVVADTFGNTKESTVWITIKDTTSPKILSVQPAGVLTININQTVYLEAIVEDDMPDYYTLTLNDSIEALDSWSSNTIINQTISFDQAGYYIWNLTFYDESNNVASYSNQIIVEIPENNEPTQIEVQARTIWDDLFLIGRFVVIYFVVKYLIRGIKKLHKKLIAKN